MLITLKLHKRERWKLNEIVTGCHIVARSLEYSPHHKDHPFSQRKIGEEAEERLFFLKKVNKTALVKKKKQQKN